MGGMSTYYDFGVLPAGYEALFEADNRRARSRGAAAPGGEMRRDGRGDRPVGREAGRRAA